MSSYKGAQCLVICQFSETARALADTLRGNQALAWSNTTVVGSRLDVVLTKGILHLARRVGYRVCPLPLDAIDLKLLPDHLHPFVIGAGQALTTSTSAHEGQSWDTPGKDPP